VARAQLRARSPVKDPFSAPGGNRIAVVDIGSNSIRLVVYDRLGRSPIPIFNEKVLCGLGRDLSLTKRLSPEGVTLALENLERFARLVDGMGITRVDALATAAVRDADDGPAFAEAVKRRTGLEMQIISGSEEARLSAMGVLSGAPDADGVIGDLGGGSLELVGVEAASIGSQITLPLGPFRLMNVGGAEMPVGYVDEVLDGVDWLAGFRGRSFHPVGGAWRSVAKVHMEWVEHPLRIIQHYTVPGDELAETARLIARQSKSSLNALKAVSKRRLETLPYACLVMSRLLERLEPAEVVFSANGLREGHLFDLLSPEAQAEDPLLAACRDIADRLDRYGFGSSAEIAPWLEVLFADAPAAERRLREAAGLVSDIGWAEHPDYRAQHAMERIMHLPVAGISHPERVFLATATLYRYGRSLADIGQQRLVDLLDDQAMKRAQRLGAALRLAHTITGGATRLLQHTRLVLDDDHVDLILPPDQSALGGEVVQRRLDSVARAMDRQGRIIVAPKAV